MDEAQMLARIAELEVENETLKKRQGNTDRIGAMWSKQSPSGTRFYSGVIELPDHDPVHFVAFHNSKKEKDTHPDYNILMSKPREAQPVGDIARDEAGFKAAQEKGEVIDLPEEATPIDPKDIPF